MDKKRILGIGIGQAGNILLNEFLNKDKRYVGLFINSAYEDMSDLKNFNYEKNAFLFPGEHGSGKNRNKAKKFVVDSLKSLTDSFVRYPLQDTVVVFFSTDGGTGSGTAPRIIQTLRKTCPNKKINIVAILPNPDKIDESSLENCLACCKELSEIENLVDDIKFIDNSKRKNYAEINKKAIDDLDKSFSIIGKSEIGTIDESDSKRINTEKGYSLILNLKEDYSPEDAIEIAEKETVFAIPDSYDCTYMAISLVENQFKVEDFENKFESVKPAYKTYNNKFNLIVLSGCSAPNEAITLIEMKLDDIKKNNGTNKKSGLSVDFEEKKEMKKDTKIKKDENIKLTYSEDELDDLVDDLEKMFDD